MSTTSPEPEYNGAITVTVPKDRPNVVRIALVLYDSGVILEMDRGMFSGALANHGTAIPLVALKVEDKPRGSHA